MIDPKLLTPENGFVEGCVVEIEWEGYSPSTEYYVWGSKMDHAQVEYMIGQYAISIRPLTGPMAIWNFCTEWADVAWIKFNGGIEWFRGSAKAWKENDQLPDDSTLIDRPFWAKGANHD